MQHLLAAVRKAAASAIWSHGVKLAGAVLCERRTDNEITCRVRDNAYPVAPTVTLYLGDQEWTCDCGSRMDPCTHVAATAIAASQGIQPAAAPAAADVAETSPASGPAPSASVAAGEEGAAGSAAVGVAGATTAMVGGSPPARIGYRLRVDGGALLLTRVVIEPGGATKPLAAPLSDPGSRAVLATLVPTHEDLLVDRAVMRRMREPIALEKLPEVLEALARAADVRFGDAPARTSGDPLRPRGHVTGDARCVTLVVERDPDLAEIVALGVGRAKDGVLRPLAEVAAYGLRWEKLPEERAFSKAELGELTTRVLPDLERRMEIDVRTSALPSKKRGMAPRLDFVVTSVESGLSVTPRIVYGEPAVAVVRGDILVPLGKEAPARDADREKKLVLLLRDELDLAPDRAMVLSGGDAARLLSRLRAFEEKHRGTATELFGDRELAPRVTIDGESMEVSFTAGDKRADPAAVFQAFQSGLTVVPLLEGGFAPLPRAWLEQHGARVAELLASRDERGRVAKVALAGLGELADELGLERPAALRALAPLFEGFEGLPRAPLPSDLRAELRDYQQRGVDWLAFVRDAGLGAVLSDDMGLGKTLQALCAISVPALVVCPNSVLHNWVAEATRFRPGLRVATYHAAKRALDPRADLTVTTYGTLRADADALAAAGWRTVLFDEAQNIKNPDSQTARAAYRVARGSPGANGANGATRASGDAGAVPFVAALTGTPVENRLEDLWSLLHATNPGLLGTLRDFRSRYAEPIAAGDAAAAATLQRRIKPLVLRRRKRDVVPELPPRTDVIDFCELEPAELDVYQTVRAAAQADVAERFGRGESPLAILEALLRLRQAACHPSLLPGREAPTSSKIERLMGTLDEAIAAGHKALVFSQWTSFLDLVEPHLEARGIAWTRLDGSTRDRAGVVETFQAADGPPVMLLSLKAGGTGLNLTAADHVFLLDPWWNPAAEDQAADRAHRIGQDRPVLVHRLVAKDTVEERVLLLQEKKRALAAVAEGGVTGELAPLTKDDLLELLA